MIPKCSNLVLGTTLGYTLGFSKTWYLSNESPLDGDFPQWYQISCKNVDRRPNYGPKTKFKMAAAAILIFFRWLFLTYGWLPTVDLNHHTKFRANISIGGWLMVTFQKFKMAAVRHLGFSKTWYLSNRSPWDGDFPSRYQIWCKNVDSAPKLWPKILQNPPVPLPVYVTGSCFCFGAIICDE